MPTKPDPIETGDTSGVHLWLVLWKAAHVIEAHAHRSIAGLNMCQSDFGVLEALLHKGKLPMQDLAAKVLLTSGSITTAVDRLEQRGLVERSNNSRDRRSRMVSLTVVGRAMIRNAFAQHKRAMEKVIASALDIPSRVQLIELLRKLGQNAEQQLAVVAKNAHVVVNHDQRRADTTQHLKELSWQKSKK